MKKKIEDSIKDIKKIKSSKEAIPKTKKDLDEKSFERIIQSGQIGNLSNSDSSEQVKSSLNEGSIAMIVAGVLVSISVAILLLFSFIHVFYIVKYVFYHFVVHSNIV